MTQTDARPITIAIGALGGQGGGVLSGWIVDAAERAGYIAQSTAVAGVAQRTGATIYGIEIFPEAACAGREPVLALYPVPGDVDVMIGAELVEAGRAVQRGFVTPELTTLIASTHRVYSMNERVAMGDARADDATILESARAAAKKLIAFDMQEPATRHGTVISATLLGALAGSGALPFSRQTFEDAIRAGGRGVDRSLAAFEEGWQGALAAADTSPPELVQLITPEPVTRWGKKVRAQLDETLPAACRPVAAEGVRRCADYQDREYAQLYLDRVIAMVERDTTSTDDYLFAREYARYLALRMCYEDTIRVADLKTRASRFERFRADVHAEPDQIVHVIEYMHPRVEEICDTLPSTMARRVLGSPRARGWLAKVAGGGRNFTTTRLRGYLPQYLLAGLRRWRRGTYRYEMEESRLERWHQAIDRAWEKDRTLALEVVRCARLLKGYGETHERGLRNYERILEAADSGEHDAASVRRLREAALEDEYGLALDAALAGA